MSNHAILGFLAPGTISFGMLLFTNLQESVVFSRVFWSFWFGGLIAAICIRYSRCSAPVKATALAVIWGYVVTIIVCLMLVAAIRHFIGVEQGV